MSKRKLLADFKAYDAALKDYIDRHADKGAPSGGNGKYPPIWPGDPIHQAMCAVQSHYPENWMPPELFDLSRELLGLSRIPKPRTDEIERETGMKAWSLRGKLYYLIHPKVSAPADDPASVAMTSKEDAVFLELGEEALPGPDLLRKLAAQKVMLSASELSRICNLPHMFARGVRNRRGSGYYRKGGGTRKEIQR
jgi:hypothetical protein